jgi:hypothetical protein
VTTRLTVLERGDTASVVPCRREMAVGGRGATRAFGTLGKGSGRVGGVRGLRNRRIPLAFLGRSCFGPADPSGLLVGRGYRRRAREWIAARAE